MEPRELTLADQHGKRRTLAEFKGSYVVLYFYPKDFTSGCTTEACDFRDAAGELRELGAVVVGVSKDSTTSHAKFDAKHGLGFTLLSDPDLETTRGFGAFGTKNMYGKIVEGVKRSTILIGPGGDVIKEWRGVKVAGHVRNVVAEIARHRAGNTGEAMSDGAVRRASAKAAGSKPGEASRTARDPKTATKTGRPSKVRGTKPTPKKPG